MSSCHFTSPLFVLTTPLGIVNTTQVYLLCPTQVTSLCVLRSLLDGTLTALATSPCSRVAHSSWHPGAASRQGLARVPLCTSASSVSPLFCSSLASSLLSIHIRFTSTFELSTPPSFLCGRSRDHNSFILTSRLLAATPTASRPLGRIRHHIRTPIRCDETESSSHKHSSPYSIRSYQNRRSRLEITPPNISSSNPSRLRPLLGR